MSLSSTSSLRGPLATAFLANKLSPAPNKRPLSTTPFRGHAIMQQSEIDHTSSNQDQYDNDSKQNNNKTPKTKTNKRKQEYEHRKHMWLQRYGSLQALQSTFGMGPNNHGGDLTPEQTRQLYHALLPRSLLALHEMGLMKPDELAPLAYEARVAAKEYARARCVWYARVATQVFDAWRQWRSHGRRNDSSTRKGPMTWDEIWSKYEAQIVQQECTEVLNDDGTSTRKCQKFDENELTMRIYLRILERSCSTNQAVDQLFLKNQGNRATSNGDNSDIEQDAVLSQMAHQLESDVREILLRPKESAKVEREEAKLKEQKLKELEKEEEANRKELQKQEKQRQKLAKKRRKQQEKKPKNEDAVVATNYAVRHDDPHKSSHTDPQRWRVLRILAGTRQKFRGKVVAQK